MRDTASEPSGHRVDVVEEDERPLVGEQADVRVSDDRCDGGDQVVGGLPIGHLVEVHRPTGLVAHPGGCDRRDARLAAATEPGEGDQPGLGVLETPDDPRDELVATVGRRAWHRQARSVTGHRVVAEIGVAGGVFEQDRRLDPLEGLARLDAQLVGHHRARLGVHLEGLLGAVLAMERRRRRPQSRSRVGCWRWRCGARRSRRRPVRAGRAARTSPR